MFVHESSRMPSNKQFKINPAKNPELANLFLDEDPDTIFIDQREIGHGAFGAVYYVSESHTHNIHTHTHSRVHTYTHVHTPVY